MAIRFKDTISINEEYTFPSQDGTADQILATDGAGNISFVDVAGGEAVKIECKNTSGSTITKGTPVYVTGTVGTSFRVQIAPADASDSAKMPAVGLLETDLANNGEGYIITGGLLKNLTTDPIDGTNTTPNDTIYVKAGGGLTMTKPTGSDLIQNIGKVGRVNTANAGSIVVSSILRTNDIPNLTEGKIWVGSANNTIESTVVHIDETNALVGIGTTSPAAPLHVNGGSSTGFATVKHLELGFTSGRGLTISTSQVVAVDDLVTFDAPTATYGQMAFKTAGSERMRIDSDGRVLIGTQTEGQANADDLTIAGTGADVGMTIRSDSDRGGKIFFSDATSGAGEYAGYIVYNHSDNSMLLGTNSSDRLNIDSSGRVGIGVTPSAWSSPNFTALQLGVGASIAGRGSAGTGDQIYISANTYYDGTTWRYIETNPASNYYQDNGEHVWRTAVNGSAGVATTFSERMRITNTGNVGINETNPSTAKLVIQTDAGSGIDLYRSATNANFEAFRFRDSSNANTEASIGWGGDQLRLNSTNNTVFTTGGTERVRIDSNGVTTFTAVNPTSGQRTSKFDALILKSNYAGGDGQPYTNFGGGLIFNNETYNGTFYDSAAIYGGIGDDSISTNEGGHLAFYTSTTKTAAPSEKVRIDPSGKVGINQSSPTAALHVVNSTTIGESIAVFEALATKNGYVYINADDNRRKSLVFQSGGVDKFSMGVGDSDELSTNTFFIGAGKGGGNNADFVINSSGNVGIGTPTPDDRLHVQGNITLTDSSPEITFETGATHYNWQLAAQENVDAAFDISVGSADGDASNDTFTNVFTVYQASSGYTLSSGSSRAPIFYDSNNTAFYCDPSNVSNFRRLYIDNDGDAAYGLTIDYSLDNPNADFYFAQKIDANFSGADNTGGDREQGGIYLDIDSSADGDADNEHRLYGIYTDMRFTGFSDLAYASFSRAESNNSTENTAQLIGAYNTAIHDTGANGGVSSMWGSTNIASVEDAGTVDNAYGSSSQVFVTSSRTTNVGDITASFAEVQIDSSAAISYGNTAVYKAIFDNNQGSTPTGTNTYLFWGDYQGTQYATNSWGIFCEGNKHQLSNTLTVTGDVRSPIFYDSNDTNYYLDPASLSILNQVDMNGRSTMKYSVSDLNSVGGNVGVTGFKGNFQASNMPGSGNYATGIEFTYHDANARTQLAAASSGSNDTGELWVRSEAWGTASWSQWWKLWHQGNDGSGSGLDADLLDGSHATSFLNTSYLSGRSISDANSADNYGVTAYYLTTSASNKPIGTDHSLLTLSYSNLWSTQLAADWRTSRLWHRGQSNGTWLSWREVALFGVAPASGADLRAPIFYDSNDTNYYLNPASTSNIHSYNRGLAEVAGWVPAYSNSDVNSVRWNTTEDATEIQSGSDAETGVAHRAIRVEAGHTYRWTINLRGNVASTSGLYIRNYLYTGDLPNGKTHVSNSASYTFVQEDSTGTLSWGVENAAVPSSWTTYEQEFTATADGYMSMVVLNWTGHGSNSIYLKTPDVQKISDAGASTYTNLYYASDTNYGLVGNDCYFDTINSGLTTDPLELVYSRGTEVRIGSGGGTKPIKASVFYEGTNTAYYLDPAATGDSIRVAGDVVAYYSSDERLKNNIIKIDSALDKVNAIGGYTFEWNEVSHKETGSKDVGVIAQEVEEIFPEIVQTRSNGYKAVNYEKLVPLLIEAVKELSEKVKMLENK